MQTSGPASMRHLAFQEPRGRSPPPRPGGQGSVTGAHGCVVGVPVGYELGTDVPLRDRGPPPLLRLHYPMCMGGSHPCDQNLPEEWGEGPGSGCPLGFQVEDTGRRGRVREDKRTKPSGQKGWQAGGRQPRGGSEEGSWRDQ